MFDLISVGGSGFIIKSKIIGIAEASGNAIMRKIKIKENEGMVLDFRRGKSARSIIYLDDGFIALSLVSVDTLRSRLEE